MALRIKPYQDLTFTDDFMFCNILQNNPDICKELIELLLARKVSSIRMAENQRIIDITPDGKGVRLDVYFEDDDTVYDIEMQTRNHRNIPKRTRYYQGIVDLNQIQAGADYCDLKGSYIIFINTFDMYGHGFPIYTFEYFCREDKSIPMRDEAIKVFVNATSKQTNMSSELRSFLDYLVSGLPCSELTGRIESKVERARSNDDWEVSYMTLADKYKEMFEDGKEEGLAEGLAKGEAIYDALIYNLHKNGMAVPEIARIAELPETKVAEIVQTSK